MRHPRDPDELNMVAITFAYALAVTAFLALQNRSPQSTFACVLLFVLFPPQARP